MYRGQSFQDTGQTYENVHFNMYYPVTQQPYNVQQAYNVNYGGNIYYNVYPSHVTCDNSTVNNATSIDRVRTRREDEKAIEQFLQGAEPAVPTKSKRKGPCQIAAAKSALISVARLNKRLEAVCAELESDVHLPEEQWQEKVNACNAAKHEICEILRTVKDVNFLSKVKKDLERCKNKRTRERRRRKEWKREKLMREERRARLHAEADAWIRKEQAVIEREKQEEKLRKDADMVLSDVRSKRSDARKYLGILQELQNLRNIKANIARARGEKLSSADDGAFNDTIAKLTEQWTTLDHEYAVEEQELKLMLKTDNEKRIEKQTKNIFEDWEHVLFGTSVLAAERSYKNVDSFIMIRTAWDKFIGSENDGTTIPIGWIVPEKPSSAAWQKCLNKETS
ncbi:PREDICTED: U11/U12 small nuclear ribonucleoprotein 59 kDa protein-like [Vollenhovia emeryi]|uniref:U11/U12 small nuclear ribonucleoprotein 59 kDa protein-like n=1 Tax=Vollenhovia emeryi TaxID=411798 RepID=UPI0005F47366|nr:PREDICTED: U11/U12 small nuclear ribonucleoprotein 59 kDa protein-like [Vollenhovia emeryi]